MSHFMAFDFSPSLVLAVSGLDEIEVGQGYK
jgi:hypothetical protein